MLLGIHKSGRLDGLLAQVRQLRSGPDFPREALV